MNPFAYLRSLIEVSQWSDGTRASPLNVMESTRTRPIAPWLHRQEALAWKETKVVYRKNLPVWERVLRAGLAVALLISALVFATSALLTTAAVVSAVLVAVTGVVGYCPMCAIAGRRVLEQGKRDA